MLISATEEQFELVKRLRDLDHVKIDWGEELAKIPNETGKARIAYEYNGVTKAKIDMRKCTIAEQKQMQALLKKNGIECVFDPREAGVICIENASKLANMEKVCAGNPFMPGTYWRTEALGLTSLSDSDAVPLSVEALNQKTSLHSRSERLKPFYDDKRIILKDLGRSNSNGYPLFEGVIDMSEYPAELQTQLGRELSYNYTLSVSNEPGKFKMQGTLEDFGLPRDMPLEEIEKINKPFEKEWLKGAFKNGHAILLDELKGLDRLVVFDNSLEENLAKMIHDGKLRFGEATVQARSGRWVKLSDAEDVKGYRFEFPKPGQQNEEIASWLKLALENRGALNNGNVLTTVNNKVVEVVESKNANQIYKETFKIFDNEYRGLNPIAGKASVSDSEKLLINLDKGNRIQKIRSKTLDGKYVGEAYRIDMSGYTLEEKTQIEDYLRDKGVNVRESRSVEGSLTIENAKEMETVLTDLKNADSEKVLINLDKGKRIQKIKSKTLDGKYVGEAYRINMSGYTLEEKTQISEYLRDKGVNVRESRSVEGSLTIENAKEMETVLTDLKNADSEKLLIKLDKGKRIQKVRSEIPGSKYVGEAYRINMSDYTVEEKKQIAEYLRDKGVNVRESQSVQGSWTIENAKEMEEKVLTKLKNADSADIVKGGNLIAKNSNSAEDIIKVASSTGKEGGMNAVLRSAAGTGANAANTLGNYAKRLKNLKNATNILKEWNVVQKGARFIK